jgi:hypothetical protein
MHGVACYGKRTNFGEDGLSGTGASLRGTGTDRSKDAPAWRSVTVSREMRS